MHDDIKRLLSAMAACAAAIPGKRKLNIHIHGCEEATLSMLVESGGSRQVLTGDGTEFDCIDLEVDDVTVYAYGEHRAIVRSKIDPAKVEAALALAAEAVSS